jgi:hypothetical protein
MPTSQQAVVEFSLSQPVESALTMELALLPQGFLEHRVDQLLFGQLVPVVVWN